MLTASYRLVSVPYRFGAMTYYDAAIRLGTEIVWQENRDPERLCSHAGSAAARARKVLAAVRVWLAAGK